jgi:NAD-dependent dihydropyrimidine dehydrogenase PreA subunit
MAWIRKCLIGSKAPPTMGRNMVKIVINYAKCVREKDRICVDICPASVFRAGKALKPEVVTAENCIMCRTCQVNCPSQAIEIVV